MSCWTKTFFVLFFFLIIAGSSFADNAERGVTGDFDFNGKCVGTDLATPVPQNAQTNLDRQIIETLLPKIQSADDWEVADQVDSSLCIPAGEHYALAFNLDEGTIEEIRPECDLPDVAMEAIARAPRWLQSDLRESFKRFFGDAGAFYLEILAEMIVNAEEHLIDEIAFTIARVSPDLWSTGYLFTDLPEVNAEGIYAADEHLDYVEIVEHGSIEEGNYWSTLQYNMKTEEGDTVQVELDPYYYYWWVVHPRISDEHPLFINPGTGQAEHPPHGVFWRDYLMNHADEDYPLLSEMLSGSQVVWSNLRCNGTAENGAVGVVNQWVRQSMVFDSRQERPIQPVRIYHLHMGRCGEHQDLTAAAARAALIPCAASMNICNDHVWNEFYINRWVVWEPVQNNLDDSLRYEGRQIPAIFKYRGDGYVENVTSRYTAGTASLHVTITDENDEPVDGARIIIASENMYGGMIFTAFAWTDSEGNADITVGDQRNIFLRIDSEVGNHPRGEGEYVRVIENSVDGEAYTWSHQLGGALELPEMTVVDYPEIEDVQLYLDVNYTAGREIVTGSVWRYSSFFADIYPAKMQMFICNEENYEAFTHGEAFEIYQTEDITEVQTIECALPSEGTWYAVFNNSYRLANYETLDIDALLWSGSGAWGIPEGADNDRQPERFGLTNIYPNPFNSSAKISFMLEKAGVARLDIIDMNGRTVSSLIAKHLSAGSHILEYNASELTGGIYVCRLKASGQTDHQKIVLVR